MADRGAFTGPGDPAGFLTAIVESAEDAILGTDLDGTVRSWNPAAERMFGYSAAEMIGKPLKVLVPPEREGEAGNRLATVARGRRGERHETTRLTKDGRTIDVALIVAPIRDADQRVVGAAMIATEIADPRRASAETQRAERLEVANRLARGIARELVDLVTAIQGHASLVLADLGDDPRASRSADAVRRATERAAEVAHQLVALSGDQVLVPRALDLNQAIAGSIRLLGEVAGRSTTIELGLDPMLPDVKVDPDQLDHVLVGLVAASRDRMRAGGRVTLATRPGSMGSATPDVVLTVHDDGTPIPPSDLDQIFEPFHTSSQTAEGNLWLATAHGILSQSGGSIRATSGGDGTTFTVRLPTAGPAPSRKARRAVQPMPQGSEWILVVDDEDGVRDFIERALERLGYHVIAASSGEEALERVRGYFAEPIDLLITDVVLPGMSGPELAAALGASRPSMPVLYISGYASDVTAFFGLPGLAAHVLAKPFAMDRLVARIRAILDERPPKGERQAVNRELRSEPEPEGLNRHTAAIRPACHRRARSATIDRRARDCVEEEQMRTLITNGTIVTADGSYVADVLIDGETIAQIGRDPAGASVTADEVLDATGRYVIPGGIDVHTHMELPFGGTFAKDTFESGTRAAAFGGTTTIVDFAVQGKGQSLRAGLDAWHAKAEGHAVADYGFHMIMSDVNDSTAGRDGRPGRRGRARLQAVHRLPGRLLQR